ncbi:hypothetical protein CONLIGDRAFT_687299 [Coniochaeta ligniaria NRRL 30616]|uniref:Uncharacterized protein n=1 Tax=Coniochaeta ligniaria NRRL 30616 TaxID=1408157 RepID=A0A1J7I546_9PEZI|nr:hypothetical protein CONLIGDRAFT_687299 [Coniochaeta ligniaria NRRL 30616]
MRMWDIRTLFLDVDRFFKSYSRYCDFDRISSDLRVAEKESNTIVEKWPMRLIHQPGQEGAQEEFKVMLRSNFTGMERYLEWKKVV